MWRMLLTGVEPLHDALDQLRMPCAPARRRYAALIQSCRNSPQ